MDANEANEQITVQEKKKTQTTKNHHQNHRNVIIKSILKWCK